jgi:hypothetical protein
MKCVWTWVWMWVWVRETYRYTHIGNKRSKYSRLSDRCDGCVFDVVGLKVQNNRVEHTKLLLDHLQMKRGEERREKRERRREERKVRNQTEQAEKK